MTGWDDTETAGAECENLPLDQAVELFFPTSEGGHLRRTKAWPKPDAHDKARRICGHCRVLGDCLEGALEKDGWTFRGGMSPEERATFGGFRDRDARRRAVYLTPRQVAARLLDAGMDVVTIAEVIARWQTRLSADSAAAEGVGSTISTEATIRDPEALEDLAHAAMGEEHPTHDHRQVS